MGKYDKKVTNQAKNTIKYYENINNLEEIPIDILRIMYKNKINKLNEKDKIIDLMAEIFYKRFKAELLLEYGFESEEQLKQCFERKAEDVKN